MRFVLYNLRYGTGGGRRLPWGGYLRRTSHNLEAITRFVGSLDPDVVGLVEVDAGSYRSARCNQAAVMAEALGHTHTYRSKYGASALAQLMPVVNKQGNALLTRDTVHREVFHYFEKGTKRLVIELELAGCVVFLVHLSLRFRVRHHQLSMLYEIVRKTSKPFIVAGDFNASWGDREIRLFMAAAGLVNANTHGLNSFPSWAPSRQLDFVLHSRGVTSRAFLMPAVLFSDHLPIVYDFDLP